MNLILHDFSFIKFWSVPCSQFLTSEYITLWPFFKLESHDEL